MRQNKIINNNKSIDIFRPQTQKKKGDKFVEMEKFTSLLTFQLILQDRDKIFNISFEFIVNF